MKARKPDAIMRPSRFVSLDPDGNDYHYTRNLVEGDEIEFVDGIWRGHYKCGSVLVALQLIQAEVLSVHFRRKRRGLGCRYSMRVISAEQPKALKGKWTLQREFNDRELNQIGRRIWRDEEAREKLVAAQCRQEKELLGRLSQVARGARKMAWYQKH